MEVSAHPRLELHLRPPSSPPQRYVAIAFGLLFGAVAMVRQPFVLGAAIVLPVTFFFLGVVVNRQRRGPLVVRFFEELLEVSGEGFRRRVPWTAVRAITETEAGLTFHGVLSQPLSIAHEQLPRDRSALLEALPPEPPLRPGEEPKKRQGPVFYLLLWLFLIGFFVAVWNLVVGP